MPWGRLDDTLYDHPKLDLLGRDRLGCIGLWVLAISWSNRHLTDGDVPMERIGRLGGTKGLAEKLVEAGLFDRTDVGYEVHDFLSFNRSRTTVLAERASERDRWQRRRSGPDSGVYSANGSGVVSGVELARAPGGTPSVPSSPSSHTRPIDRSRIVDEREMTDAERDARLQERLAKRTGVS